jgi:hypothetical protein
VTLPKTGLSVVRTFGPLGINIIVFKPTPFIQYIVILIQVDDLLFELSFQLPTVVVCTHGALIYAKF